MAVIKASAAGRLAGGLDTVDDAQTSKIIALVEP